MFNKIKILGYFFAIVLLYTIIVRLDLLNNSFPQNSTFGSNVEIGEKYFYNDNVSDFVFLGSSISNIVGFKNIARATCIPFTASSSIESIRLINNKVKKPKIVFIEVNTIYTSQIGISNEVMFLSKLRRLFPSLYHKNKPLKKIMWLLMSIKDKVQYELKLNINERKRVVYKKIDREKYIIERERIKPDITQIAYNMDLLEKELLKLKESNVRCYLIEIPVHSRIVYGERHQYLINKVSEVSKRLDVDFLRFNYEEYSWTDGVHMTTDSKNRFQEALANRVSFLELKQ